MSGLLTVALFFLIQTANTASAQETKPVIINSVKILDQNFNPLNEATLLSPLIVQKPQTELNQLQVRQSIENLNRCGLFTKIEARLQQKKEGNILYFLLTPRLKIRAVRVRSNLLVEQKELKNLLFPYQKNRLYSPNILARIKNSLQEWLESCGYRLIRIDQQLLEQKNGLIVIIDLKLAPPLIISAIQISGVSGELKEKIRKLFSAHRLWSPQKIEISRQKAINLLKKEGFLKAEVELEKGYLQSSPQLILLNIKIISGAKYLFTFSGMRNQKKLILDIWEKKVFENWALQESISRIQNKLFNRGYLLASVKGEIIDRQSDNLKEIRFTINRYNQFRLKSVEFSGNRAFSTERLTSIIQSDNSFFHRFFYLRFDSLLLDLEVLRIFYLYNGFNNARISFSPLYSRKDITLQIRLEEDEKQIIRKINFSGNRFFSDQQLLQAINSRTDGAYVSRMVNEDISRLQQLYQKNGFLEVKAELAAKNEKNFWDLEFKIEEGKQNYFEQLIIFGASPVQKKIVERLFPLKPEEPFDQEKFNSFIRQIEQSNIFAEIKTNRLELNPQKITVICNLIPERAKFYGLGLGWEERKGLRTTFEYYQRNIFNSYSSLSALLQLGLNERRGLISYNLPYFTSNHFQLNIKLWEENESYFSYTFNRFGVSFAVNKKIGEDFIFNSSLRWYRTSLTELLIPEYGVDQLKKPFDTTLFTVSLVRDNRNNPFNPTSGSFFSADLRLGLPVFEKNYTFYKIFWNYQYHFPLFQGGAFSLSVKNGMGFGDMSITERFFAGGTNSFRGTRNDRLGPLYTDSEGNTYPSGGNILLILNAELTFPQFLPVENFYTGIFLDLGNVFSKSTDLDFGKLEKAIGISLKYRTAIGPLRLDLAVNPRAAAVPNFLVQIGVGNVY